MDFPERFENLPLYAFTRLRELFDGVESAEREISSGVFNIGSGTVIIDLIVIHMRYDN